MSIPDQLIQLLQQGKTLEALTLCETILASTPDDAQTRYIYGIALAQTGKLSEAIGALSTFPIAQLPVEGRNALAICYHESGNSDEAEKILLASEQETPHPNTLNRLAVIYNEKKQYQRAEYYSARCVQLFPDFYPAYISLSIALNELDKPRQSLSMLEQAEILVQQLTPEIIINRANSLRALGRYTEALHFLELIKDQATLREEVLTNISHIYNRQGLFAEQQKVLEQVIDINSENAHACWNLALLQLAQEDYLHGWEGYQYGQPAGTRTKLPESINSNASPDLEQSMVLVINEQGVGEELLFSSCYKQFSTMVAQLLIACDNRLIPLFQQNFPNLRFIDRTSPVDTDRFDYIFLAGDIASLLRKNSDDFPSSPCLSSVFGDRDTSNKEQTRIGISWRGGKNLEEQQYRSISLETFGTILTPNYTWVALQHDTDELEQEMIDELGINTVGFDLKQDLYALARELHSLDLVVTVDNSIAHMAGALGIPCWVLVPVSPYWVWGLKSNKTPWYPSISIFRQTEVFNWDKTLQRIKKELPLFVSGK